jgi:hypothetical protein
MNNNQPIPMKIGIQLPFHVSSPLVGEEKGEGEQES